MKKEPKLLFVSSSGGHFEQLKMLKPLMNKYKSCMITERVPSAGKADYYMIQMCHSDKLIIFKFLINFFRALRIWIKEKPNVVISTGSMAVIPFSMIAKLFRKKIVFIETFAKLNNPTMTGKYMYKRANLFIIQWESLRKYYPNAVYGGSIYL